MAVVWLILRIFSLLGIIQVALSDLDLLLDGPKQGWTITGKAVTGQIANWFYSSDANQYAVCDVASNVEPANWLRTDFIPTKDAKRLNIYITYAIRKCRPVNTHCKEKFELYGYYAKLSDRPPDPMKINFDFIKAANPIHLPLDKAKKSEYNTMNVSLVPQKDGIYLAFSDKGACVSISDVKVNFNYCPARGVGLVDFVRTVSEFNDTKLKKVEGKCISQHSINTTALTAVCTSIGDWNLGSDVNCLCKQGFQYVTSSGSKADCEGCPRGYFKNTLSNSRCIKCPANSQPNRERSMCLCHPDDYFRFDKSNSTIPCKALPEGPLFVNSTALNATAVRLSWMPPRQNYDSLMFSIDCFVCTDPEEEDCVVRCSDEVFYSPGNNEIKGTNASISGLEPSTRYMFKVYSFIEINKVAKRSQWKYAKTFATTKKGPGETIPPKPGSEFRKLALYIGIPVVVILIIIVTVFAIIMCKRQRPGMIKVPDFSDGQVELPTIGQRVYIDPSNYNDPEEALRNFAKELDTRWIKLEEVIGGGEFGNVYKGMLKRPGESAIPVAVKTLKEGSTRKNRDDFLSEASVMGQFCDPNVVFLEGVVSKTHPLMIITEFMSNGSLDNYLKKMDSKLSLIQLMGMARGMASGMKFLAEMNFVHRDVAARNILVTETLVCKVADFGLSRELEDSAYETKGGKIPVRWTAPEAIKYRKFSTSSDIWSYGILLWETFSFAERPYWDWSNFEVMDRVETGYRLPPPMSCPKVIHQIMLDCWLADRTQRPKFADIVKQLDVLIRSPEKLKQDRPAIASKPDIDYSEMTTIDEWLDSIKMGQYCDHFRQAGYSNLRNVAEYEEPDLEDLGVRLIGHKNKIRKSIREVKDKLKRVSSVPV